ncbi:tRNA (adenosine(37)-N6)-dimethylallyltransferase MiaA [Aureibaculum sp. 2210JD6-5]|uniref:tRNA (adenosine(37)-N6)-dimethylallyltransferase MiaA n=1 Tax=Aureibaculum sp. 2210JD6-5 TaxID=3103957 RepID=UPI002AAC5001|nr:tRNA (adenosine(37)-N6)-dimethylallyltransferase MiaA [Aureibaculum sp. 2210JD6-5]MDY7394226.1 tRNA (adenosine(37)-N6)-dimethylallyltransferase MiaA [Aureibaculum sp. 2210JD6-5]
MTNYLITIVGPTAIGKTELSIAVANHFNTEIISSDSRQFYKEMNIGTAVPDQDELKAVKHHCIQHISIHDSYSVGHFEKDATLKLGELFKQHKVVVMVGGSGLYTDAVLYGLDNFPKVDPQIRKDLKLQFKDKGISALQKQLKDLDAETYQNIDLENHQRVIRALEICIGTGKPFSSFQTKNKVKRNFIPIKIGLTTDRKIVYNRINKRVDIMIENGLLKEAKKLFKHKELNALQTVGYKELFKYFEEEYTLDFAIEEIKKNTRRFAKRQLTWYRKDEDILWFDYKEKPEKIVDSLNRLIV